MGVSRKIPLPAPTESTILHTSGDDVPIDVATDISRRTDRTSYSIPEDGSPITVSTSAKGDKTAKSHTSLLIEYFEGGKGPNTSSRPSVRVKVTPSAGKKGKETRDHIQITETVDGRKPSYSRRIALPSRGREETHTLETDSHSISSLAEGSGDSARHPIEIEVMHKDQDSDLSERRYTINPSEISSMPPDSMLEAEVTPKKTRSGGLGKAALAGAAAAVGSAAVASTLKSPSRRRSRSLSRERITRQVIERLEKDGIVKHKHKSKSSSRSPSLSQEQLSETLSSPRRRSGKHRKLEEPSETSGVTDSQVSGASYRSDTSKYSATNPKLLQAVEDSVRRLFLPEINAIKAQRKRDSLESATKNEGSHSRRVSGHSEEGRSREGSIKKRRSKTSDKYDRSPSERSFDHGMSQETVIHESGKHRRRSKESGKLRDAALGAVAGGLLTHAALKDHDSTSSVDRRERRRKRSKSQSRSHSVVSGAETEEIFNKHDVAPMPMRSELTNSDLTRDSILSEKTSTGSFEPQHAEIREIARVSPKQVYASGRNKVKSPSGLRHAQSYEDTVEQEDEYSHHSESYDGSPQKKHFDHAALGAAAAGAGLLAAHHVYESDQAPTRGPGRYVLGRSLSPIQSVASYEEHGVSRHNSQRKTRSTGSLSSLNKQNESELDAREEYEDELLKKKHRPVGINLESRSEVLVGQEVKSPPATNQRHFSHGSWYEGDDKRNSAASYDSSRVPIGRLTQYTDDSMDAPDLDKVTAAQEVREGPEGNAQWVYTPVAVESAVASLLEPSVLDAQSTGSGPSYARGARLDSPDSGARHEYGTNAGYVDSPLKQAHGINYTEDNNYDNLNVAPRKAQIERSPRQSPPHSARERDSVGPIMTGNAMPDLNDPMPEIMHFHSSKSDISTNPPDIQGPKKYDSPVHWPYHGASARGSKADQLQTSNSAHESLNNAAAKMLSVAAGAGAAAALAQQHRQTEDPNTLDRKMSVEDYGTVGNHGYVPETHVINSPFLKDEGYETNVPNRTPGVLTPDNRRKGVAVTDPSFGMGLNNVDMDDEDDDVFGGGNLKRMSGNSHGMAPLYDAATGDGRDRIESKDIIALMDHLAVRDAQRNARDTEILVTLVRSAAEMRNSFEEVKRFIADQDNMLISVGNKQHEKTQRVIGGPRPQPTRGLRRTDSAESMIDDIPPKRRSVLRRALKGLSGKNSNDLAKIEDMLYHLLQEVADLKAGQGLTAPASIARGPGLSSYEQLRDLPRNSQEGYEPEGHAGTSPVNHSGHFSPDPKSAPHQSPQQDRRRASARNRISTVMEEHEDNEPLTPSEQHVLEYDNTEHMLTPTGNKDRGSSVPLASPPRIQQDVLPKSVENTPKTDKSRRQKSTSSSFFPKISRWSKTTASTVPDRSSKQYANESTSGVDLVNYDVNEHYNPEGDDRLRSADSLVRDRPASPLIPSEVSRMSEDPTYHAHRNSVNLQHPQPRQGPTARFQNHLESQVRDLSSPISPSSDHFGSNPVLARYNHGATANRNSGAGHLSPISDINDGNTATAPARPPKIKDDGPLIPPKIPIEQSSPQSGTRKQTFLSRSMAGQQMPPSSPSPRPMSNNGSLSPAPGRKPTGPRPLTTSGSYTPDKIVQLQRNRYRGSPNAIDVDSEVEVISAMRRGDVKDMDAESETF